MVVHCLGPRFRGCVTPESNFRDSSSSKHHVGICRGFTSVTIVQRALFGLSVDEFAVKFWSFCSKVLHDQ